MEKLAFNCIGVIFIVLAQLLSFQTWYFENWINEKINNHVISTSKWTENTSQIQIVENNLNWTRGHEAHRNEYHARHALFIHTANARSSAIAMIESKQIKHIRCCTMYSPKDEIVHCHDSPAECSICIYLHTTWKTVNEWICQKDIQFSHFHANDGDTSSANPIHFEHTSCNNWKMTNAFGRSVDSFPQCDKLIKLLKIDWKMQHNCHSGATFSSSLHHVVYIRPETCFSPIKEKIDGFVYVFR